MPIDHPANWYLRKHENGEVFGPTPFEQIREWALAAQVNPQDMVSNDGEVWTKAPMIPELKMDWLVEAGDVLYGPTTADALMEFVRLGEITRDTAILNCCSGEAMRLSDAPFFSEEALHPAIEALRTTQPSKGGIKVSLQRRVRELETALIEKRLQLNVATDTIAKLEAKIRDLEKRVAEVRPLRR